VPIARKVDSTSRLTSTDDDVAIGLVGWSSRNGLSPSPLLRLTK